MKTMKTQVTGFFVLFTCNAVLALPNFDPFADATAGGGTAYAVGSPLSGNNQNGTNDWQLVNSNVVGTNPQPMIVAGNLTYPDLLVTSTGNSISNTPPAAGTGGSARLDLRLSAAPSLAFYSFILKVTDLTAVPSANANNFIAGFSDTSGAQAGNLQRAGGRLVIKQSGGGYVLGIGKGTATAEYAYDTNAYSVGAVVYVVVSYERAGGQTNVNLWVNPAAASFGAVSPPAPVASITNGVPTGDMNASGIDAFVISCQTTAMPSCIIDEVRVATSWGIVTGGSPTFPIAITSDPASRTVKAGDRVSFVVANSGTAPAYQWRFNGSDISDATNSYYTLTNADLTNNGSFSVVITNTVNAKTSAPAVLTIFSTNLHLFETNLIVVRVGDGAQTLSTSGNSVFLDQLTTNGAYINTVFIPDTGPSAFLESGPDVSGTVLTGTALTRSLDKRFMTLAGYNASLGNATALQSTTAAAVPRAIVTVDTNSQISMVIADTTAYSAAHFRGAVTDGANNFWGSGSTGGTYYFGLNAPAAFVQTSFANTRSVDIFNGDLYCLGSQTGANGLIKMTGLPTTDQGAVGNILTGFNNNNTTDFSVDSTGNLVYLTVGSTVQRWSFGGSWANDYALTLPAAGRYLTVDYSGASPVLYVDTADGQLYKIVDTGAASPATLIAASGPNQLFKGIRFGPSANPVIARPTLSYQRIGSDFILSWTGAFTLQSSTNVTGPYGDVSGSSPHTNSINSAARQFFRVRN